MGNGVTIKEHHERVNRVLQFIQNHLDENLDLISLSEMSCYSPFHFHRIMRAYLGESLGVYIQRARLGAAVHLLKLSNVPVSEVALKVGYDTPSSFNKAFRKRFGFSPTYFRENQNVELPFDHVKLKETSMEGISMKPTFVSLPDQKVIYVSAIGPYNKSAKEAWDAVCAFAGRNHLFGANSQFYGLSYDDPTVTEPDKCRYEACLTVPTEVKPNGKVGYKVIAGGKFAVFLVKGPHTKLISAYNYIYGTWVIESKVELGDAVCMEKYLNSPSEVKPQDLLTEIYVPMAK